MKKQQTGFIKLLADFFTSYLPDVKGLSKNTITSYQYAFQLLFEFLYNKKGLLPEKVTFDTLSSDTILEYLAWLETDRQCSANTRNQRHAAVSSFARYALKKAFKESVSFCADVADMPKKKTPVNNEVKHFTKEEISILLKLPDTSRMIGRRDVVLMSVLYSSGARAQEICDLSANDIKFGSTTTIRLKGKGQKARMVVIPDNCAKLLKNYIESKRLNTVDRELRLQHVFPSQTHEKMTISCVEGIVRKYVSLAKNLHPSLFRHPSYSPHSFRHSIAVHMLECGESLAVIKAFLGHSSIATTLVYATVTPELANKYLIERGRALVGIECEQDVKLLDWSLPFLRKTTKTK